MFGFVCEWIKKSRQKPLKEVKQPTPEETKEHDDSRGFVLYYPNAFYVGTDMAYNQYYLDNYPTGAVVHYTADLNSPSMIMKYLRSKKYAAIVIDRDGRVYQDFPVNQWGNHAGASRWPAGGTTGTTVNNQFVGIELISGGKLEVIADKHSTWYGKQINESEIRYSNHDANISAGQYHMFTSAQEKALTEFIMWLYFNSPKKNSRRIFNLMNVCGHDEVSPGRKTDPGACLSMTMYDYRSYLHGEMMSRLDDFSTN